MKNRLLLILLSSFAFTLFSHPALAKLPDLSGTYNCKGWDYIEGGFEKVQNILTLKMKGKDSTGQEVNGYEIAIKNYGVEHDSYQGFAVTSDGIHMSVYFANTNTNMPTDNGTAMVTFHSEHGVTSYSGPHYQPNFSNGKKMYDYGNVVCKKTS